MFKKVTLFAAVVCLSAAAVFSQAAARNSSARAITEFDVNGLTVIVKRRPASPTVSAGLFVRGGVKNQTAEKAGLESFALSLATEASKKFPRDVLRKELSRTGSTIGAGSNYDFSVISLSSTLPNFDGTWDIFTDIVLNPAFTQSDFDLLRDRTITALRNRGVSPDDALNSLEERTLYSGHPYAADPSGTPETLQKFTLEEVRSYYRSLLESSRLLLVVVGDIDPVTFKDRVSASFGKLPKGSYKQEPITPLTFAKSNVDISQRNLQTNYIKGVFAAPSIGDPDYYAMRVMMTFLQSRVYQEIRTARNLSYAPNAEMDMNAANTAHMYVTTTDPDQSVAIMLNIANAMKRDLVDTEEVGRIAGYFLTTYYLQQETNAAQVRELAMYELYGGGWEKSLQFLDGIRKVTPEQIRAVANKYVKNLRFFVVGDPNKINRDVFTGTE
jgi:zinc protease